MTNPSGNASKGTTRRDFLTGSVASAAAIPWLSSVEHLAAAHPSSSKKALKVLILGGTGFIGPHLVRSCLARDHTVTLFNRGKTNTHLFPDVEKLKGDRASDLTVLKGRKWDIVIDNSAVIKPAWVRDSAALLRDAVDTYLFTSTRSVYKKFAEVGMTEDAPLLDVEPEWTETRDRIPYGQAKVLCEHELRQVFGERSTIVRPGLIVGPGDRTDRFTYWPVTIAAGGDVLAPGDPNNHAMFIDVRDLADFYVHLAEQGTHGVFNALGPEAPLSFAELLYGIRAVTNANVRFHWVDTDFLLEQKVRPYADLPMWRPARGDFAGFQRFDLTRPLRAGLKYRPLAVTAKDTLDFHLARPAERRAKLRSGLRPEKQQALLAAWAESGKAKKG